MILLTGATGFLGSNLLKSLLDRNNEVIVLKRSNSNTTRIDELSKSFVSENMDKIKVSELFNKYTIKKVIHTATCYGRNGESDHEIFNSNLTFPLEIAHYGSKMELEVFYNTSTSLPKELNAYSLSKKQLEDWLIIYSKKFKVINISPQYFYGPMDDSSKFVSMLITKMKSHVNEILLSPCTQKRDFFYIDDLVDAYIKVMEKESSLNNYSLFEVGSGKSISLRKLVLKVANMTNYDISKLNFGAIPLRENELLDSKADLTFIKKIGWYPKTSLDKGLHQTLKFVS